MLLVVVVVCCIFHGALLKLSLHFPLALQRSRLQLRFIIPPLPSLPTTTTTLSIPSLLPLMFQPCCILSVPSSCFSCSSSVSCDFSQISGNQIVSNARRPICDAQRRHKGSRHGAFLTYMVKPRIKTQIRRGSEMSCACVGEKTYALRFFIYVRAMHYACTCVRRHVRLLHSLFPA